MELIILSIVLFFIILFVSAYFANKPFLFVEKRHLRETDEKSLKSILLEEGKLMRSSEDGGFGIRKIRFYSEIARANRVVTNKVKHEKELNEAEKWLYENFYLVYRYCFGNKNDMRRLPHYNGEPRIVRIARIIVSNSLNALTAERVRGALKELKGVVNFSYDEIVSFNDAFSFALLECIFNLAQRINYDEKCKNMASGGYFLKKNITKDVYLYHFISNTKQSKKGRKILAKNGLDESLIKINYNNVLLKNTCIAETFFSALNNVETFLPPHIGLKYLGAYQQLSQTINPENVSLQTLSEYFKRIGRIAKKTGTSEDYVCKKLIEFSRKEKIDISIILLGNLTKLKQYCKGKNVCIENRDKRGFEFLYAISVFFLAGAATAFVGYLTGNIVYSLLCYVPLIFFSENVIDYLAAHLKCGFDTPSMNYKSIAFENTTMVIYSEFITSIKDFEESVFKAETIYEANRDENVYVSLLIDTKGDKYPVGNLEREIEEFCESKDFDRHINVFIRKKTYANGKFISKERKRGALMAIAKALVTREDFEFLYIRNKNFITPKYIITLDSDNTLMPGAVLQSVNMMEHPFNASYDILSFSGRYDLFSMKNLYANGYVCDAGFETYPFFSPLYYKLFSKSVFCGKGIIRLENFYNKLEETLPSKKILSHDILEGSVLKTGAGVICFEDAPQSFISEQDRIKRWKRGDLLLLRFIFGRWRNDNKNKIKLHFSHLNRYIMVKNAIGLLKNITLLSLFIISAFSGNNYLIISLIVFLLPYGLSLIKAIRGFSSGGSIRKTILSFLKIIYKAAEDFFLLAYYAVEDIKIIVFTLLKIVLRKNLLDWKTFKSSQKENDSFRYLYEFTFTSVVLTVLSVCLSFLTPIGIYFSAYTVGFWLFAICLYCQEKITIYPKMVSKEKQDLLRNVAHSTYKYFDFLRQPNGLIGDNLQVRPYKGISSNTSPTNLGFGLLAEVCAYYLGITSKDECFYQLEKGVAGLERLEKWEGNLFNWYNVVTMAPIGRFVSSVDNGNLLVALLIVKAFSKQNDEEILYKRVEKIIKEMRLDRLFDSSKKLFYIGFDGNKYVGHYDLLASESRVLSFLYIALMKDNDHYYALQKDFSGAQGNILLSWSGTMFETLMPELFFHSPKGSLLYTSAKGTTKIQSALKKDGIWGVSESGFAVTDEKLLYQYKAFGLKNLALSQDVEEDVISPYSSILALSFSPERVCENIEKMLERGYGFEYGLYESIDFTYKEKIVYSAMSHHQGMILCAITNYLCDGALKKILLRDPQISSIKNFFNETPPSGRYAYRIKNHHKKYVSVNDDYFVGFIPSAQRANASVLTNGNFTSVCKSIGGGYVTLQDVYLNRYFGQYTEDDGIFFFASENGKEWASPTYLPFCDEEEKYSFKYGQKEIIYETTDKLRQSMILLPDINGQVLKFNAEKKYKKMAFYFDICLDTEDGYISHPTFKDLFVNVLPIASDTIMVTKRTVGEKESFFYCIVRVSGIKGIEWECNRMNYLGRGSGLKNADFLFGKNEKKFSSLGDVLFPCVGFKGDFSATNECQVTVVLGRNKDELMQTINSLPKDAYKFALQAKENFCFSQKSNETIGEILYSAYPQNVLRKIIRDGDEEKFRLFCQRKKTIRYDFDENRPEKIDRFLDLLKEMRSVGIALKAIIYCREALSSESEKYIVNKLRRNEINDFIFIIGDDKRKDWCVVKLNENCEIIKKQERKDIVFEALQSKIVHRNTLNDYPEITFKTGCGGFDSMGRYVITNRPLLPYANVMGNRFGGIITTDLGGGFSYFGNSRENKSFRFLNDATENRKGEYFFVKNGNEYEDITDCLQGNGYCLTEKGKQVFKYVSDAFESSVLMQTICDGRAKLTEIKVRKKFSSQLDFVYAFFPCVDWKHDGLFLAMMCENDIFHIKNLKNGRELYLRFWGSDHSSAVFSEEETDVPYFVYPCENMQENISIVQSEDKSLLFSLNEENISVLKKTELDYYRSISPMDIVSGIKSFDYLTDMLPYQIMSSRINAKAGFYQVGGATGFRDQAQDVLAFYMDTCLLKNQIKKMCEHQYEEGDVMHWWHEPKFGLRTQITDDKLFLPFAVTQYLKYSQDVDFLQEQYAFLHSAPLTPDEKDRFENPPLTDYKESVFQHCLRAIRSALKYGKHRLLIMGSGDWNDGMNYIGEKGYGESVFNSMFCYKVLNDFSSYCPIDLQNEMRTIANDLKTAINTFAFDGDRYMRLYSDDGRWLGTEKTSSLKIDLLTQAFAVLSGVADGERAIMCLNAAKSLIDDDNGLIKLLYPPQSRKDYLGYISDYPSGVRENGGQYTHAAMWYLIALTKVGRQDEAFDLFQKINPAEKCSDEIMNERYKGEPYVLSGDIYTNFYNEGRSGWTWYTGSASWAYKLVTEYFYGIKKRGDDLFIRPCLPKKLLGSVIMLRYKNSNYVLEYQKGLFDKITIDGEKAEKICLEENTRKKIIVEIGI